MAVFQNSIVPAAAASDEEVVTRSLRFDGSAYLEETLGSSSVTNNGKVWTIAMWVKLGAIEDNLTLFHTKVWPDYFRLQYKSTGELSILDRYSSQISFTTTAKYRDPSAWHHVTAIYDSTSSTSTDRMQIWVNGVRQSGTWSGTIPQNRVSRMFTAETHRIGTIYNGSSYVSHMDGYLADVYGVDGSAVEPIGNFIESNDYGGYKPKAYDMSSHGGNSFHFTFEDNTNIGEDSTSNGNDFTATNLASSDVVLDRPSNNYATLNPLDKNSNVSLSEGNLRTETSTGGGHYPVFSTIGVSSGKWYFEAVRPSGESNNFKLAIMNLAHDSGSLSIDSTVGNSTSSVNKVGYGISASTGNKAHDTTDASYGSALGSGEVLMCAFDLDNGKIWWGKDGTWFASGDPANGTNAAFTGIDTSVVWGVCVHFYNGHDTVLNFGQDPTFAGNKTSGQDSSQSEFYYAPPSGFKALCTANLDEPTVTPHENFEIAQWVGNETAGKVISTDISPDLVWIKNRDVAKNHTVGDSLRGANKALITNNTNSESTATTNITAFDTDASGGYSFTLGTSEKVNDSGQNHVGWVWKESATAGFDIVTWTGNSDMYGARSISHNLGVAPEMIIAKVRDDSNGSSYGSSGDWIVYHKDLGTGSNGYQKFLRLNSTSAAEEGGYQGSGAPIDNPTSTTFDVDNDGSYDNSVDYFTNFSYYGSSDTYVAYLFSSVEGYSKAFSLSSSSDAFCYLGFRPAFLIIKRIDSAQNWLIFDNKREGYNVDNNIILPNSSASEYTTDYIDILSNGFKVRTTQASIAAGTLVGLAFAESPLKHANAR